MSDRKFIRLYIAGAVLLAGLLVVGLLLRRPQTDYTIARAQAGGLIAERWKIDAERIEIKKSYSTDEMYFVCWADTATGEVRMDFFKYLSTSSLGYVGGRRSDGKMNIYRLVETETETVVVYGDNCDATYQSYCVAQGDKSKTEDIPAEYLLSVYVVSKSDGPGSVAFLDADRVALGEYHFCEYPFGE